MQAAGEVIVAGAFSLVAALAARAHQKLSEGRPLEAIHLLDIALTAEPAQHDALTAKKEALQILLRESGGTNLSETMWLNSEIAAVDAALGSSPSANS